MLLAELTFRQAMAVGLSVGGVVFVALVVWILRVAR